MGDFLKKLNMKHKNKIILDLCGGTGAWSKPYKDSGYDVRVITLPDYDVRQWWKYPEIAEPVEQGNVYGIIAAPPCTQFSRARTTAKTARDFLGAMQIVNACLEIIHSCQYYHSFYLKFWAIENPRGLLTRFLGKPPFSFQPYDFGDRYQKETYIWGNFNFPKKNSIPLTQQEIEFSNKNIRPLPKIKGLSVADRRAITPAGFANAFFKANP